MEEWKWGVCAVVTNAIVIDHRPAAVVVVVVVRVGFCIGGVLVWRYEAGWWWVGVVCVSNAFV